MRLQATSTEVIWGAREEEECLEIRDTWRESRSENERLIIVT